MISNMSQIVQTSLPKASETVPAASSSAPVVNASAQVAASTANPQSAPNAVAKAAKNGGGVDQALSDAVDKLNNKVQNLNRNLEFSLDKGSGELLVKVVDSSTREVIRQIPSKEALAMAENIDKYMQEHSGGLLKTKA